MILVDFLFRCYLFVETEQIFFIGRASKAWQAPTWKRGLAIEYIYIY